MALAHFVLKWAGNQGGGNFTPRVVHRERDRHPGHDIWLVGPFDTSKACCDWARRKQRDDDDDPRWQEVCIEVDDTAAIGRTLGSFRGQASKMSSLTIPIRDPGHPDA